MQRRLILTIATGACLLSGAALAKPKLPKGVILPPGVVVPDDFELPEGISIPAGFEISQDMVDQYVKYMDKKKNGDSDEKDDEDLWFKQLATNHPNSNLQMNVIKMDTAAANEESQFQSKLEETFMSKEVILPTIAVVIIVIAVWAFMTKCGKRSCCKKERLPPKSVVTRKSVKSDRSETNNDLESGSQFSNPINSEGSSQFGQSNRGKLVGASKQVEMEFTSTAKVGRSSEPSKASANAALQAQGHNTRQSNLSATVPNQNSAVNRFSLPTVSVPIDQIKSRRSQGTSSIAETVSDSKPSSMQFSRD